MTLAIRSFMHNALGYPQLRSGRWFLPRRPEKLEAAGNGRWEPAKARQQMNETTVTIIGNVITDVKARRTAEGARVANFRIASNERRFDKATGDWVDGDRLFVTVTCWRKLANGVAASLSKGDPVVVTGRLFTRGYEVEGQKRSVTEVDAIAVGPDLSRCSAELLRVRRAASEDAPIASEAAESPSVPTQATPADLEQERPALAAVGSASS